MLFFIRRPFIKLNLLVKWRALLLTGSVLIILAFVGKTIFLIATDTPAQKNHRVWQIDYQLTVTDLPETAKIKIWLPVPADYRNIQNVSPVEIHSSLPARQVVDREYGNKIIYLEAPRTKYPTLKINYNCEITRTEQKNQPVPVRESPEMLQRFLQPDKLVAVDERIKNMAELITKDQADTRNKARAIYDYVFNNMTYDKSGTGWGCGDTEFACCYKKGNCTDFHSLFISLARASGIPARFIMGYPVPEEPAGRLTNYHCWAEFYIPEQGWIPADISEAWKHPEKKDYFFGSVDKNRIHFTTGRDINLEPLQNTGPLNYFVYPHIETNGILWTKYDLKVYYKEK